MWAGGARTVSSSREAPGISGATPKTTTPTQMRILTEKEKESQFKAKAKPLTSHRNPTGIIAECVEKMLANMAIECQTQLQKYDKNLSDATRFYLQHLEALDNSIPLHQLTAAIRAEFQRRLTAGECSHRHWEGMRYALRKLDQQYGQRDAQTLGGQ